MSVGQTRGRRSSVASNARGKSGGRKGSAARKSKMARKSLSLDPSEEEKMLPEDAEAGGRKQPNLKGDWGNFYLLLFLYTLQGLPMGFADLMPMLVTERGASLTETGLLDTVAIPFSLKLLWAPFVDYFFIPKFGRRKTWLVPTQMAIGVVLIIVSTQFDKWLPAADTGKPIELLNLWAVFFGLFFLCATQDVVVDGWALTMLREENVGYQSTANALGQSLGFGIGYYGGINLAGWGVLSISGFMFVSGVVFLVSTVLVALLRSEKAPAKGEYIESWGKAMSDCGRIISMKSVQQLVAMLLLWKIPFTATERVAARRIQQAGVSKEQISFIALLVAPVPLLIPVLCQKWTVGKGALRLCANVYVPRIALALMTILLVKNVPGDLVTPSTERTAFFFALTLHSLLTVTLATISFVALMSFFAQISPKRIGGTYMTLLNTFANLGGMWVSPVFSYCADRVTSTTAETEHQMDGFSVTVAICGVLGILAFPALRHRVAVFQSYTKEQWFSTKARGKK